MTHKRGGGNPPLPDSELETGDQENVCLFQKYQLAAQLAVLTKGPAGGGGRGEVRRETELGRVFWSRTI